MARSDTDIADGPPPGSSGKKPSRPMRIACWIAHADADLAAESSALDRLMIAMQALILLFAWLVATGVWTLFFHGFKPLPQALVYAAVIGLAVFLVDRAMVGSDWALAGILTSQRRRVTDWLKQLLLRLAIALPFSIVTGLAATMHLASDVIEAQIQASREALNAPLEAAALERIEEARTRLLGTVHTQLERQHTEREAARERAAKARQARDAAQADAAQAELEAGRQADGYSGRRPGEGLEYNEARRQQVAATIRLRAAIADQEAAQAEVQRLAAALERGSAQQAEASRVFAEESRRIHDEKVRDPRWRQARDDSLMRFEALAALRASPERGRVIGLFVLATAGVLLIIELIPLLCKFVLGHASVYMLKLRLRTTYEAHKAQANHQRQLEALGGPRPDGRFRLPPGDAEPGS